MSISSFTLNAIQKAGASAFAADEKLKREVQSYAERVSMAMVKNPYNLGNDALIEGWKVLARLSKTMSGIEEELKNIHRIACELAEDDQPSVGETPVLVSPVAKNAKVKQIDAAVTTVKVKAKKTTPAKTGAGVPRAIDTTKFLAKHRDTKKAVTVMPVATPAKAAPDKAVEKATSTKSQPKASGQVTVKATVKAKPKKAKAAGVPVQVQELQGNSAKLMAYLLGVLNTSDYSDINQSAVSKVAGIPLGSMGATIARLVKAGRIEGGSNGSLKLAAIPAAAPLTTQAGSQQDASAPVDLAAHA